MQHHRCSTLIHERAMRVKHLLIKLGHCATEQSCTGLPKADAIGIEASGHRDAGVMLPAQADSALWFVASRSRAHLPAAAGGLRRRCLSLLRLHAIDHLSCQAVQTSTQEWRAIQLAHCRLMHACKLSRAIACRMPLDEHASVSQTFWSHCAAPQSSKLHTVPTVSCGSATKYTKLESMVMRSFGITKIPSLCVSTCCICVIDSMPDSTFLRAVPLSKL